MTALTDAAALAEDYRTLMDALAALGGLNEANNGQKAQLAAYQAQAEALIAEDLPASVLAGLASVAGSAEVLVARAPAGLVVLANRVQAVATVYAPEVIHAASAPTITSSASASVAENAPLAHSLTASEAVTWSIAGGADQSLFEIHSGSTLRFVGNATKNYEAPDDADANRAYLVQVRATNAGTSFASQTITVTLTNVIELTLAALALAASTIEDGAAEDTVVGLVQNTSAGSTLSLTDTAGGRFKLVAGVVRAGATATDYGAATSHNITIREAHADASNSPRDTVISITVEEAAAAVITWDQAESNSSTSSNFSNGDLTVERVQGTPLKGRANGWVSDSGAGGVVWEITSNVITGGTFSQAFGIESENFNRVTMWLGDTNSGLGCWNNAAVVLNEVDISTFDHAAGDTVMVHLIFIPSGTKTIEFIKPGLSSGPIDISATFSGDTVWPSYELDGAGDKLTGNFGATSFTNTAPLGAVAFNLVAEGGEEGGGGGGDTLAGDAEALVAAIESANGGDTILAEPGTYDPIFLTDVQPSSEVVIMPSDPENPPVFEYLQTVTCNNLTFRNIDVSKPGSGFECHVKIAGGGTGVRMEGCRIYGEQSDSGIGVRIFEETDCVIEDCEISMCTDAMTIQASVDCVVQNNTFHHLMSDGIRMTGINTRCTVHGNTFTDFTLANGVSHIDVISFPSESGNQIDCTITDNIFVRGGSTLIYYEQSSPGGPYDLGPFTCAPPVQFLFLTAPGSGTTTVTGNHALGGHDWGVAIHSQENVVCSNNKIQGYGDYIPPFFKPYEPHIDVHGCDSVIAEGNQTTEYFSFYGNGVESFADNTVIGNRAEPWPTLEEYLAELEA